jgi:hypothetical protein
MKSECLSCCWRLTTAGAAHPGGRCFVNQGLLIAIERFVAHRSDKGTRLTLATGAQFHQSVQDGLGGDASLRGLRAEFRRGVLD